MKLRTDSLTRLLATIALLLSLSPLATAAEGGNRVVQTEEMWCVDEDNEDVMLGAVGQVITDGTGNIYILDRQQGQVVVFSPEGEFLRQIIKEGDGPGEVRSPRDMLVMADGSIGVTQMIPGKITMVSPEGVPSGEIRLQAGGNSGLFALFNARFRGGTLVAVGDQLGADPAVVSRTRFLSTITPEGLEKTRLLSDEMVQSASGFTWDEDKDYFVHMGGLALGPDGLIYAAPHRNRYRIDVFRPDGTVVRTIERDFKLRKRSQAEIKAVSDTRRMIRDGVEIPKRIGTHAPAIGNLWVDEGNRLWVQHGRSGTDQPAGVFQTYDIFDEQGAFVEQRAIRCPGDPAQDRLFLLPGDRAMLVRGYTGGMLALVGARGAGGEEDDAAAPLELVFYRLIIQPTGV